MLVEKRELLKFKSSLFINFFLEEKMILSTEQRLKAHANLFSDILKVRTDEETPEETLILNDVAECIIFDVENELNKIN